MIAGGQRIFELFMDAVQMYQKEYKLRQIAGQFKLYLILLFCFNVFLENYLCILISVYLYH